MDYLWIAIGTGAILLGIIGPKMQVSDEFGVGYKVEKYLPRWLSRRLCLILGIVFLYVGLASLGSK